MNTPFETRVADAMAAPRPSPAEATGERYTDIAVPLAAATSGRLRIVPGASRITIAADPALADLCRMRLYGEAPRVETEAEAVTLRYTRQSALAWVKDLVEEERAATILLTGALPWRIEVEGGASRLYANLSRLRLEALQIGGGASQVELSLPHPAGIVLLRVAGGASQVTIHRPPGAAARLTIRGGASRLSFDGQQAAAAGGELRWQSPDAEQAADCFEIEVAGGVSDLLLDEQGSAAPPRLQDGTSAGAINRDDLPYTGLSHELEGYLYGDVPASLIFLNGPPGSGPKLHRHPYAEIFVILEGRATFTVGEATIEAAGGQILVAPAGVPHKFINSGSGPLRQIDMHTNPRFITEWLED